MARTFRTLSLSLPPEAFARLAISGLALGKTAGRVAAEIVLRDLALVESLAVSAKEDDVTDPIERHLSDIDSAFAMFRDRAVNALRDAWMSVETMRGRVHDAEAERDRHRRALNQIADMLHVVHEDPKIVDAVTKMVKPAPGTPVRSAPEALALQRVAALWPRDKKEADALALALSFFVETLRNDESDYPDQVALLEAMLTRAGMTV